MPRPPLDEKLADLLGSPAAGVLAGWARMTRLAFGLDRMLVNGRSGAIVAAVYEWAPDGTTRKLILKHGLVEEQESDAEYARQSKAYHDAPYAFGHSHLARLAHEPIPVPDGSWITFQDVVGGGPQPYHVMTSLLAGDQAAKVAGLQVEPVACSRDEFAEVCGSICYAILSEWAQRPVLEVMPASEFIQRHLQYRATEGHSLYRLARDWTMSRISFDGEPAELINPFRLVFDIPRQFDVPVPAILGRAHGDLHTENILVSQDRRTFTLIDLPRYEEDAPLTRDPIHLILSVISQTMDEFSAEHRRILLDAFTRKVDEVDWGSLPSWVSTLVQGTGQMGLRWIGQTGLAQEWREVMPLSVLCCALMFAGRQTTTEPAQEWFVHLAARAADAFAQQITIGLENPEPNRSMASGVPESGLGELCRDLGRKRHLARARQAEADLDRLLNRARMGHDIRADYARLMHRIGYQNATRNGLPGLGPGVPVTEMFHCPMAKPCTRTDFRGPHGEVPYCFVRSDAMTISVS